MTVLLPSSPPTPLRQWIVRTFPRITWQARLRRTGFLCGLRTTIATAGSIFSFNHEFHRLIQKDGGSCLRVARPSNLALFCWPPEPTRSVCRLKARLILSSIISARSLIARRSLPRQLLQNVWWLLVPVLSAWKLPHRCAPAEFL